MKHTYTERKIHRIFRTNVETLLEKYQWRRADLARAVGCNRAHVTNILNGSIKPALPTVIRWANALDVPPHKLLHN